eukprot:jgi/Mesvir1/1701/Mv21160-RA.1
MALCGRSVTSLAHPSRLTEREKVLCRLPNEFWGVPCLRGSVQQSSVLFPGARQMGGVPRGTLEIECKISIIDPKTSEYMRRSIVDLVQFECRQCHGQGMVPCAACDGKGALARGGYQKKNPVNLSRIIGSKWTACESTFGWRHFEVKSVRKNGKATFCELVATCDETARFWINAGNLKDRSQWFMGWVRKEDLEGDAATQGAVCRSCNGQCQVACPMCAAARGGGDDKPGPINWRPSRAATSEYGPRVCSPYFTPTRLAYEVGNIEC